MISGKLLQKLLFQRKTERPLRGILRNIAYSLGASLICFIVIKIIYWQYDFIYLLGIVIISLGFFFFGWGIERLWYYTISKITENSFSLTAYLSRIPFWYVGGGMGFSLPLLFAKKFELIYIFDVPQYQYFIIGGILQIVVQIPLQYLLYKSLVDEVKTYSQDRNK